MNKARKRMIEGNRNDLLTVVNNITQIRCYELGDLANMSITMQSYTPRQRSEEAIKSLNAAIYFVNKAVNRLDSIK